MLRPIMRICTRCKAEKPIGDFYTHPRSGHLERCKECVKFLARERTAKKRTARIAAGLVKRRPYPHWVVKHGHRSPKNTSPEYQSWRSMNNRCHNPNNPDYRLYGARGVKVCDQWRGDFSAFLADMGPRPDGRTLDRIDPYGNYEPGNCRWATHQQQRHNQRRNKHV